MKVLIADKFEASGVEGLRAAGCEVVHEPDLKDEALARAIAATQADVLVVRSTRVTEAMLEAGRLSLVVRAGAGYNTIDVAAASRRGIYVSNCPGKNSIAVAELTMALILALDRRVADNVAELRAGRWNKKEYSKARGLYGRTLGLLGAGNIAREVIRRGVAFGLDVILWSRRFDGEDRPLSREEAAELGLEPTVPVALAPSPAEVAARCDILSVHLALSPATRGLIDAALLARLKPGALVINTSRGEMVDPEALAAAVREKGLRVGLDVYAAEPSAATGEMSDPIIHLPGVYGTHHIGASTEQAQEAIAAETVRIVRTYLQTGEVPNVVNLSRKTPASHMLVVRHRDRPGVLAHVFEHLREGNLNVQETENIVFEGAEAAVARINLDLAPPPALLDEIRSGNTDVLDLRLIAL
ncbi:MAG TPA: 3-phosphoglycerate dehydrogenase family protein [Thermoanaerobaculia bacterium]|nr:3-phosphoglycerate dehydrogenase family protein [Thermoanaerobaculia bacterium]